ncbi:hypothetical protein P167DRAFT_604992 [Morchella conica CCBAS932]|uniref:Uncharacterized protein n=1 Tax=Morchella conica CCBAS932 TaxID=1392247 RepID=A0A3N4KYG2_9PEZI|nr:hypothetical protein P167DRAFT_604992 [Morchella conica CCBAS932]
MPPPLFRLFSFVISFLSFSFLNWCLLDLFCGFGFGLAGWLIGWLVGWFFLFPLSLPPYIYFFSLGREGKREDCDLVFVSLFFIALCFCFITLHRYTYKKVGNLAWARHGMDGGLIDS